MDRRRFVQGAAFLPMAAAAARAESVWPRLEREHFESAAASAAGMPRLDLTLQRVLKGQSPAYTEEFLLADVRPAPVRRFTEFSGDLSGRYIGALATATRVYGMEFPNLDRLVAKVIALQKPEGYFGAGFHAENLTDADLALLWGNGRLLVGLMEYHRLKPTEATLATCRRLGDWLVGIGPLMLSDRVRQQFGAQHFASSYICWTQQTEGLALLYAATRDERYRDLTVQIAGAIERRPSDHVHGYLTSLRGVMELHSTTQDARLLQQCETAWEDISASNDALITGGVPEGWSPNNHRTEGCGEADWVRLNLQLWSATRKARYLETAERAVFNELAFNQFATGDFGHRVYTDTGFSGAGAARAWWCCTLHGLRAFPDIDSNVFRVTEDGLSYEMPLQGRFTTDTLSAVAESSFEENGTVRIRIAAAKPGVHRLRVRKPAWAEKMTLHANGPGGLAEEKDGYASIERAWNPGDSVEVQYAMKLRTNSGPDSRVSYWFGPWLLSAAAADNPAYFNELTTENRLQVGRERPLPSDRQSRNAFCVPIAAVTVPCAFAEYPDQPGSVTLRAIAEQAGQNTTAWEMRFLPGQEANALRKDSGVNAGEDRTGY